MIFLNSFYFVILFVKPLLFFLTLNINTTETMWKPIPDFLYVERKPTVSHVVFPYTISAITHYNSTLKRSPTGNLGLLFFLV